MHAIGPRRVLAGIALALTAVAGLAPIAPVEARAPRVTENPIIGQSNIVFAAPIPIDVAPPGYLLGQ